MIIVVKDELMVMVPSWIVIVLCVVGALSMVVRTMLNIEEIRLKKQEAKARSMAKKEKGS